MLLLLCLVAAVFVLAALGVAIWRLQGQGAASGSQGAAAAQQAPGAGSQADAPPLITPDETVQPDPRPEPAFDPVVVEPEATTLVEEEEIQIFDETEVAQDDTPTPSNQPLGFDPNIDPLTAGLQDVAVEGDHLRGFADPFYTQCLNMALDNGAQGLARAEAWNASGGGTAALHCTAFARQTLGDWAEAARLFDLVGSRTRAVEPALAAAAYLEAGQAYGNEASDFAAAGDQDQARTQFQAALSAFESALDLEPDNPDTPVDYGMFLGDFGYSQQALDLADQALRLDAQHLPALWLKALMAGDLGQDALALSLLEQIKSLDPLGPYGLAARQELGAPELTPTIDLDTSL